MSTEKRSKRENRINPKLFWSITVVCVLIVVTGAVSDAIFTSSLNAQRTIAAYDTEAERFSSNYLLKGDSKDNVRTAYTTNVALPVTAVVTVCNYPQGRQTLTFDENITYTLTAKLVKYDASTLQKYVDATAEYISSQSLTGYTVSISDGTNTRTLGNATLSTTFSGADYALTGGSADSDAFTIAFSANFANDLPNLYLEITATPSSPRLPTLRAVLKPEHRVAGAVDVWTGSFRDDTASAPSAYDGYNYLITGTGTGTATLSWDSTKVTLSDVSRDVLLSISGASQSGDTITFPVDSDIESRYDLQFYKTNVSSETWQQMNSQAVTFVFS